MKVSGHVCMFGASIVQRSTIFLLKLFYHFLEKKIFSICCCCFRINTSLMSLNSNLVLLFICCIWWLLLLWLRYCGDLWFPTLRRFPVGWSPHFFCISLLIIYFYCMFHTCVHRFCGVPCDFFIKTIFMTPS